MRLLIVEDDVTLNEQLCVAFTDAGYAVDKAFDGEEGLYLGDTETYDAVVLDVGLPAVDGMSVLDQWRKQNRDMPVLVLTARDQWSEKVEAFNSGADDYVTKPFVMEEVLARIRALVRRSSGRSVDVIECGAIQFDARTGRVTRDGESVRLTALEFRIIAHLFQNLERVVSRSELNEQLYPQEYERNSNTIEVFIGRLRKKLGAEHIITERGLGYRLSPTPTNAPVPATQN